ncbi:heavy metal-associated domain containing protein [Musa troglodytarum]|uniref:Heavy metal-associated domain containing protein n=2 Tax=Musa troglodytarum TaxID=320322 RepID=A0A9E7HQV1_9LILI|nr:heavy metal-associated domain containing protein [Musa troglodytarum]
MASLLFKEKRGANFSCVSPASAAICTSIDRRSMVQPSTGRAIDRHTPHLRDPRRVKATVNSMSQTPTKPKTCNQKNGKSLERPSAAFGAPGSTRYLLDDEADDAYFDAMLPDLEPVPPLISLGPPSLRALMREEPARPRPSSAARTQHQVVVLRVSLHCKGCEGKVRKHISRMEGVTSYDIDFATKKVTVVGDVTPLGVLSSISKVKHAQFWPSPPRAPAALGQQRL